MRIAIFLDPARLLGWHLRLRDDLRANGHNVLLCRSPQHRPWPPAMKLSTRLEQLLYRFPPGQCSMPPDAEHPDGMMDVTGLPAVDILVNLSGALDAIPRAPIVLTPTYNGDVDDLAAWTALARSRDVELGVMAGIVEAIPFLTGHVALSDAGVLVRAMSCIYSGVGDLVIKAIASPGLAYQQTADRSRVTAPRASSSGLPLLARSVASASGKIARRLKAPTPRWAVAWRHAPERGLLCDPSAPASASFSILPDDGARYYADPFLFARDGRTFLFVEELPIATDKGVISVCEIGPNGPVGRPRVVLEEPTHLSYPFVFEEEGDIWMIPESGASATVPLYRCTRFPDCWVKECDLIAGAALYDATLQSASDGGYWMLATPVRWQSTSWDRLSIFHAPALRGPWTPHRGNPVQLDPRSSRPAGRVLRSGESVLRPAQDGSSEYGGAVTIAQIDELTQSGYRQSVIGTIAAEHRGACCGIHTYDRRGEIEVVDVYAAIDADQPAVATYRPATTTR